MELKIMKKLFVVLAIIFVITGCPSNSTPKPSTEKYKGVTEEQAAENRIRPYRDGMKALNEYKIETGCDTKNVSTIKSYISNLENQVTTWSKLKFFDDLRERAEVTKGWHTELAFGFADESLKKECLDNADTTYRSLVNFYIGGAYVGVRDRAKIGIDDVRSAKRK